MTEKDPLEILLAEREKNRARRAADYRASLRFHEDLLGRLGAVRSVLDALTQEIQESLDLLREEQGAPRKPAPLGPPGPPANTGRVPVTAVDLFDSVDSPETEES